MSRIDFPAILIKGQCFVAEDKVDFETKDIDFNASRSEASLRDKLCEGSSISRFRQEFNYFSLKSLKRWESTWDSGEECNHDSVRDEFLFLRVELSL